MTRLFIIDQSLTQGGNHHFDYVRLLARSANSAGVRPVIATNRTLDRAAAVSLEQLGDVRPHFRQTVYTSLSYLAGLAELRHTGPTRQTETSTGAGPLRRWWNNRRRARNVRARSHWISRFAEDCESFFDGYILDESDQVFFTTMSELDLMGLAGFLSNQPRSLLPTWHVQFHFGIYSGRPAEYERQSAARRLVHECFQSALARVPYHTLRFYATSSELLEQYREFRLVRFEPLPYPIEPRLAENHSRIAPVDRPLRLTVAGAIRREKAQKQYLGGLIAGLGNPRPGSIPVELHLQGADSRTFGRRAILGRDADKIVSEADYRQRVHVHPHPLPDDRYRELISRSDIGLLYYDGRRYYARRAGILGEFLASGKPVIVPAGSWLSRQVSESVFRHIEQVTRCSRQVESVSVDQTARDSCSNVPLARGVISFDQLRNPFRCWYEPLTSGRWQNVVVRFRWQWPREREEFVNITVRFFDEAQALTGETRQILSRREVGGESLAMFRCPAGMARCEFVFRNAYNDSSITLGNAEFSFLDSGSETEIPLSSVGMIVADPTELAAAVDEIARHYSHYLRSAVDYAETHAPLHDPDCTLDALLDRQCRYRKAA